MTGQVFIDDSTWLATLPLVRGIPLRMLRALEGHVESAAHEMVDMWGRDLETLRTLQANWRAGDLPEPYATLRDATSEDSPGLNDFRQTIRRVSALVSCPPVQWAPWSATDQRRAALRTLIGADAQWSLLANEPLVAVVALAAASEQLLELRGNVLLAEGRTVQLSTGDRLAAEQLVSGRLQPMAPEDAVGLPQSLVETLAETDAGLMLQARRAIAVRDEFRCPWIRGGWSGGFLPLRLAGQFGRVESLSLFWGDGAAAIPEARWRRPPWTLSFGVDIHPAVAMHRQSPELLVTTEGWASGELRYMDQSLSDDEMIDAQETALRSSRRHDSPSISWAADDPRCPADLPLLPLAYGEDGAWWRDSYRMWCIFVDYLFRSHGLTMPAHLPGFGWFHPGGARWPD